MLKSNTEDRKKSSKRGILSTAGICKVFKRTTLWKNVLSRIAQNHRCMMRLIPSLCKKKIKNLFWIFVSKREKIFISEMQVFFTSTIQSGQVSVIQWTMRDIQITLINRVKTSSSLSNNSSQSFQILRKGKVPLGVHFINIFSVFFTRKCFAQLLSSYSLAL